MLSRHMTEEGTDVLGLKAFPTPSFRSGWDEDEALSARMAAQSGVEGVKRPTSARVCKREQSRQ